MRIMICEDNRAVLKQNGDIIQQVLSEMGLNACVELYDDGRALLGAFACTSYADYIFMDIELPAVDGLEISKEIRKLDTNCRIILLTAYERYAIEGYEVEAYRYLLKPLQPGAVYKIFRDTWNSAESKYIVIDMGSQKVSVLKQSILYAETIGRKTAVVTGEAVYHSRIKLDELEKQLGIGFLRCHKSYIVNLEHCVSLTLTSLTLSDQTVIPVSRPYSQGVRHAFFDYFNEKQGGK